MTDKPKMSIHRDGDTLVLRCPLAMNHRLPRLYEGMLRLRGDTLGARAAFALLVQAIALCAPSLEDAHDLLDQAEVTADPNPGSMNVH